MPTPRLPKMLQELDPSRGIPIGFGDLHIRTRRNLEQLEDQLGIEWTAVYKFPVDRSYDRLKEGGGFVPGVGFQYERVPATAHSFLIMGKGPTGEDIRYVRRETKSEGAGNTYLFFDGRQVRLDLLKERLEKGGIEGLPLTQAASLIGQYHRPGPLPELPEEGRRLSLEEIPQSDRETLEEFERYLGIKWSEPRLVPDPRFAKFGEEIGFFRLSGNTPEGESLQYLKPYPTRKGVTKPTIRYKGRSYSPEDLLRVSKQHYDSLEPLSQGLELESVRTTGSTLEGFSTVGIASGGERIELVTLPGKGNVVKVNGKLIEPGSYRLLTNPSWQPPSGGSYRTIEDKLEFARRARDWEEKQMELRTGRGGAGSMPRRTGGPGFYERVLKPLERPGRLYHVTPRENIPDILREGLTRRIATREHWMAPLEYLSQNILTARGPSPAIVEIDLSRLDPRKLVQRGDTTSYEGDIPPEAVRELRFIVDYPEPEDR